jgi:Na+-driven multidrug efflux pump
MLLLIKVLASYGDNTVAAMGIVTKANMLIEFVQQGIANGILALLGYNYGIGNMPRFKKILRFSFFLTCGIGIVLSAVYIFSGGALIQLFINDTSVIEKGISMSVVLAISGVTYGILFVCVSAMQALERPLPATIISLCRQGIFFIPLLFIFNTIFGFYGAISVQTVTNYLSAIIAIFLLRYCFKKANTKPVLQVKKE